MLRSIRLLLLGAVVFALVGCDHDVVRTSEIKLDGVATGTKESGYGDMKGDAVGGGGDTQATETRQPGEGD